MITFRNLKWGNAFSYGDHNEIDFTEAVVTQIVGVNGYGKSSIPLILEEITFNKNSKGIKKGDIPNRYINKGYWMQLLFNEDEDEIFVDVERKANTLKIKLSKNGEDISSHTATETFKTLEKIIGMDFKMFAQLVYQNTTSSLQFLTATDTNRKKFLIDLLQLEEYIRLFEIFKDAVKQHALIVTNIEGQLQTVERWLESNKLENTTIKELIPVEDLDLTHDEQKSAQLSFEISNIDKTNKQIARNNQYKQLLESINIEEINAIEAKPPQSYDEEQSELGGLQADSKRINAYIKKLNGLGDTCPTCEQSVDPEFKTKLIEQEKEELETIDAKIKELNESISRIKSNNQRHEHKQTSIKEWEELFASINHALPSELVNKQDLVDELSNIGIRLSNVRTKLKQVTLENQEIAKHNSRISVIMEQAEKFQNEVSELQEKLSTEQSNLSNLELLKKSFSTNGLVAYKIENMVKDLENLTNEYLAELSDGRFTIEFSVSSDKLNVIVTDNGKVIDIIALSSGELARVNIATLLALRKLMSSISKSKINVLFLDEVTSVLDEAGREKVVEVLLEEDLNTYIVSHGWTHPLLNKLEVVKEDNISRIEHG